MKPPRSAVDRLTILLSVLLTHGTLLLAMARTMDPVVRLEIAVAVLLYALISLTILVFGGTE